jgi:hypothetical protein
MATDISLGSVHVVGASPGPSYTSGVYIHRQQAKDQKELSRLASETFPSNHNPRQPMTAFQAPAIDRLQRHLGLLVQGPRFQIAVTLGAGALQILGHGIIEPCDAR